MTTNDDNDHRIIADVLNEVNGFIDSLENDNAGRQFFSPTQAYDKSENDGVCEEADILTDNQTIPMPATNNLGGTGTCIADELNNIRSIGNNADALSESEELYSSLSRRYLYEKNDVGDVDDALAVVNNNNNVNDESDNISDYINESKSKLHYDYSKKETSANEEEEEDITRASEDLYNTIKNQSYTNTNTNSNRNINTNDNYSISGSTAKSGGSSVENVRPPSSYHQTQSQQQQQHEPIHHKKQLQNNNNMSSYPKKKQQQQQGLVQKSFNWQQEVPRSRFRQNQSSRKSTPMPVPANNGTDVQVKNISSTPQPEAPAKVLPSRVLSPFSAKARQSVLLQGQSSTASAATTQSTEERISFSLQNCRKVSLLLKVDSHPQHLTTTLGNGEEKRGGAVEEVDQVDEDGYGPILFPALMMDEEPQTAARGVDGEQLDKTINRSSPLMKHGEVILVNPNAFDNAEEEEVGSTAKKRIAGRVTVDTARLVAEVVSHYLHLFSAKCSHFYVSLIIKISYL